MCGTCQFIGYIADSHAREPWTPRRPWGKQLFYERASTDTQVTFGNVSVQSTSASTSASPTFQGTQGSGGWHFDYMLDGTTYTVGAISAGNNTYTGTAVISADGTHSMTYRAVDTAGNEESYQGPVALRIDKSPPVTRATPDRAANNNGCR